MSGYLVNSDGSAPLPGGLGDGSSLSSNVLPPLPGGLQNFAQTINGDLGSAISGSGAPLGYNNATSGNTSSTTNGTINKDALYIRIAIGALALILFAGAIYVYKR